MSIRTVTKVGASGGSSTPAFSDAFAIKIVAPEANLAPTDADTFLLNLLEADSNVSATETATANIKGLGDSSTAPTDTDTTLIRYWLSATTMDSTNGVTNPANANGQHDGADATYTSVAAGDANPRTHSTVGASIGTVTFSTAVFRGWFKSANTLATSTTTLVMHSTTGAFTDITMFSNTAVTTTIDHSAGDFTFDLVAAGVNTLAKLQSCQLLMSTKDAAAGVTPAVLTADAGCIELQGVF